MLIAEGCSIIGTLSVLGHPSPNDPTVELIPPVVVMVVVEFVVVDVVEPGDRFVPIGSVLPMACGDW